MALWQGILIGVVALLAAAIALEVWLKRNRPRPPLAVRFLGEAGPEHPPEAEGRPELGMEAIDMAVIRRSERANRAAALGARDMEFWGRILRASQRPKAPSSGRPRGNDEPRKQEK